VLAARAFPLDRAGRLVDSLKREIVMTESCRAVTADEIAHYREHGWVKLSAFVPPELVAALLATAQAKMGSDGQGNAVSPYRQSFFNPEMTGGPADPQLRPLIDGVGRNARALMERGPRIEARYFGDLFAAKLPVAKETRHPGAGATYFHQDYVNWALDRSGGMTFWIALADFAPESGTMAFLSGSHSTGALGHYRAFGDGDIFDDFPELRERCPRSEPMTYAAGDATVHSNLTVHGAGENRTGVPRWAYIVMANPSDARWNGAPPEAYDTAGMQHLQPLDDERFPVIG
jgi:hypothetical protein